MLSTGSSTIAQHSSVQRASHRRGESEDSTVVLIDGNASGLNDNWEHPHIQRPRPIEREFPRPSYSEFFDTEKMKLSSIRLRTDLNQIVNMFNSQVDEEIPVLRYSQDLRRQNITKQVKSRKDKKRSRKCQIL